jgi:hypothetical protein
MLSRDDCSKDHVPKMIVLRDFQGMFVQPGSRQLEATYAIEKGLRLEEWGEGVLGFAPPQPLRLQVCFRRDGRDSRILN